MSRIAGLTALAILWLLALPFVIYALDFGWRGLIGLPDHYLFNTARPIANGAIALHMVMGAFVTALAFAQALLHPRRTGRFIRLHRWLGRLVSGLAILTALGGLSFIALRGTIGGAPMDAGFALYGLCMGLAAVQTYRLARAGDRARHRRWALRLVVLAMASWIFRLHYTIWQITTDLAYSTPDLTGPFDRVQLLAFFVPYLLLLELWFRFERR